MKIIEKVNNRRAAKQQERDEAARWWSTNQPISGVHLRVRSVDPIVGIGTTADYRVEATLDHLLQTPRRVAFEHRLNPESCLVFHPSSVKTSATVADEDYFTVSPGEPSRPGKEVLVRTAGEERHVQAIVTTFVLVKRRSEPALRGPFRETRIDTP